jgi:DNA helicase-2/ATP-dependent DNA helicase PcrA
MVNDQALAVIHAIGMRDHNITSEYRIFGSPGTGKTTRLADEVGRAVEKYGPSGVLVTSFSRGAAAELAGRDLPVSPDRVGTLHSHCWHALGGPMIAEANVDEWNRDNPHLKLTPARAQRKFDGEESIEDDDDSIKDGDLLLQALNRSRGLMLDQTSWPARIREFSSKWNRYKNSLELLDFCDLIERCLRGIAVAPKSPEVILTDEAQDLTRMQSTLIRKWGERASYFVNAGDDDQTLYSFTGASPDAMLDPPIPYDHRIILEQSYRVPRAVHQFAEALIHKVTRRQEKVYLARPEEGAVKRLSSGYKCPDYEILTTAMKHLEQGKKIMFLASCSYMLRPLLKVLRKNAIPFHNPYRKSNGFWNPLRLGRHGSAVSRVLSLLTAHPEFGERQEPWTHGDLALWGEWLSVAGILKPDGKLLSSFDPRQQVAPDCLAEIFEPRALNSLLTASERGCRDLLEWWRTRVAADFYPRIQFPAAIAVRRGPQALVETPRVVVGTIHSVKGGQADVVYLFPDLSSAGDAQYRVPGPSRDSVIRVFYVGATRARETLYICGRESARSVVL